MAKDYVVMSTTNDGRDVWQDFYETAEDATYAAMDEWQRIHWRERKNAYVYSAKVVERDEDGEMDTWEDYPFSFDSEDLKNREKAILLILTEVLDGFDIKFIERAIFDSYEGLMDDDATIADYLEEMTNTDFEMVYFDAMRHALSRRAQ